MKEGQDAPNVPHPYPLLLGGIRISRCKLTSAWLTSISGAVSSNLIVSVWPLADARLKAVSRPSCWEIESGGIELKKVTYTVSAKSRRRRDHLVLLNIESVLLTIMSCRRKSDRVRVVTIERCRKYGIK